MSGGLRCRLAKRRSRRGKGIFEGHGNGDGRVLRARPASYALDSARPHVSTHLRKSRGRIHLLAVGHLSSRGRLWRVDRLLPSLVGLGNVLGELPTGATLGHGDVGGARTLLWCWWKLVAKRSSVGHFVVVATAAKAVSAQTPRDRAAPTRSDSRWILAI